MMIVLLGMLSVLGNYFCLPFFFEANFIFGSIIVLIIIQWFGIGWGSFVALIASSTTFFSWGHGYGMLIFTLEALFVGITWQRHGNNLLLWEGIFWLCLGLPIIVLLYTFILPREVTQISLIALTFLINGIVNASIACMIITFFPQVPWLDLPVSRHRPPLQQILLNLIAAFVLLPTLITMTINGWIIANKIETEIQNDLNILLKNVTNDLRLRYNQQVQSLQEIAKIIAVTNLQDSADLAQHISHQLILLNEFLEITVVDTNGIPKLTYTTEPEALNIYSQTLHQPQFQSVLTSPQVLTFQTRLTQDNSVIPIMAHAVSIQRDGQIIGAVIGYLNLLEILYKVHAVHTLNKQAQVTLLNDQNLVINSTRSDLIPLTPYDHPLDNLSISHESVFQETTHIPRQSWREIFHLQQAIVDEHLPIIVVVEVPLQSYIESWQQLYVIKLIIISIIAFLSLILAVIISRWLVKPLLKLANITDNLPHRLEKNRFIQWPTSKVKEIDSLTNNFKSMAESLQIRFDEIHSAKDLLEQRVQTRTQELLHERALLRNLIDSIPDLISYKDGSSIFLGCNKAFNKFVGIHEEAELIGKTDFDLFPREMAEWFRETDQQMLATGQPCTFEEWVVYPDSRRVLLETLKTPFFAPDGQILGLINISRDMTARKQSEEALRQSQMMLRLVIDNIPQLIFWKDQKGSYLGCNQNFTQLLNIASPEAIVGRTDEELINNLPVENTCLETINRCITADGQVKYQQVESINLTKDSALWLEMNQIPLRDPDDQIIGVLGSLEDITERKQVEERLKQSIKVLENSAEAILITDAQPRIITVNKAFTQITGYSEEEALGKSTTLLKSGKHSHKFYKNMWRSINQLGYWEGEIWNRRKNGEIFPEWLHISVIKDEITDKVTNYLAIFSDLTIRKQTEQRLTYLAHYDDLTGLPNRILFYERVSRALYHAQQKGDMVAVMFLDLDGFKYVNDTWGHLVGDLLLKEVANRLTECQRQTDTIARLGGDDFTLVLEHVKNIQEAEKFAQNILKVMRTPFHLNQHETFITVSIGISLYPNNGEDVETLLKNADAAMYRAKENGKNNYQFFTPQIKIKFHKRLFMETQLRYALERDEFVLYYQPQKHLASGHIIGTEVLLRWQHPDMGLMLPYTFIPLAEETGLIVPIGEWVLRHTCLQHQIWRNNGQPILRMSVNLSSRQFKQCNLMKSVLRILDETNIDPTLLELELTESLLIQDIDFAEKILNQLKEMGIQLAIDDFGTGYSSLTYLKRFPVDKLKIDQSFVRDIPKDKNDMSITRAIIALAHSLQLSVIAEGVETQSQQAFLKSLKCDEAQGYLIGRPLPKKEFIELLLMGNG